MTARKGDKAKPAAKPRAKRDRRTEQPKYAQAAKLRTQILELRTLGRTIAQIAEAVNRAPSVVHTHLKHALEELTAEQTEQAAKMQALAYNRLERMLAKAMLKAAGGDLKAMREATRLIQAQARLMGWGMPAARNPETGEGFGVDGASAPPGHWTLPMRPTVTIEDWQRQAEAAWQEQQKREAEALGG